MKKVYLNVGLPENLAEELKNAVEDGIASTKTELIRKAISQEIKNINKISVGGGTLKQDNYGRIYGYEKRIFLFSLEHFGFFKKSLIDKFGMQKAEEIITNAAYDSGKEAAIKRSRRINRKSLDDIIKDAETFKHIGWGKMEVKKDSNKITSYINHSWEAESYVDIFKQKSSNPICWWIKGYQKGILEGYLNKEIPIEEKKCFAMGGSRCEIIATI